MYFFSDMASPATPFKSKSRSHSHARTYSHPVVPLSLAPTVPEVSLSNQLSVVGLNHSNASQTNAVATPATLRHPHFTSYVLELVKVLQASLAVCGMFPLSPLPRSGPMFDGLLCDATVDGVRKWGAEVGENFSGFEVSDYLMVEYGS